MRVSNRLGPRGHALVDSALVKPAVATIQRQSLTHGETVYSSLPWSQDGMIIPQLKSSSALSSSVVT